ncbi:hypothetical protein KQX54_007662 [Cotesia glomerata]|uniref:Uncharacterized protein n=1 Tax=Cotesia glomerata TaxID=32391 RepID=A0AAV7J2A7_COTGL|nr:hypothetical protein KQX54_007662 [Cotesia glomerata]
MIGNDNKERDKDDLPKRRSTFYVSLENDTRHCHPKITKCLSQDADKYACNTFPISATKNAPILSRTFSNKDGLNKRSETSTSIVGMNTDTETGTGSGTRGKVQSLTRMFETPQIVVESIEDTTQRKKVERTRSFKTIERFQNRFVGRKDTDKKNIRLNNTIGCLEINREDQSNETERRSKRKDEARTKILRIQGPNRINNNNNNSNNNNDNNNNSKIKIKNSNENNSLSNLLIRRTHSTKVVRSASAHVKSSSVSSRHVSVDCPGNSSIDKSKFRCNDSDNECENNFYEDADESVFEETEAVHSDLTVLALVASTFDIDKGSGLIARIKLK